MYPLTFAQAAADLGQLRSDQTQISKVIIDSRKAVPNCLFFALPGTKADGHQFVPDVLRAGGFAVVKKGYGDDPRLIEVDDPLAALQQLARAHLRRIGIPVVAITGSNGKTTTKDITARILQTRFQVCKTQDNYNNEIGVPLTIFSLEEHHQILVLEMGMRGLGQIRHLTEIAPPDVAVITNIYPVHLELLGSMENIAAAKAEIVEGLKPGGIAVLNDDDPWVRRAATLAENVVYFGKNGANQLSADNLTVDADGKPRFTVHWYGESYHVSLDVPGIHNVYNCLAAMAVGLCFQIHLADAIASLRDIHLTGMRFQIEKCSHGITIVNDAYNASPASMHAALETLAAIQTTQRKVAILGDMLELGPISETAHEAVGEQAAHVCEQLVFVGKNAEMMQKGALKAGISPAHVRIYSAVDQLLNELTDLVKPNDLVLVKASRGIALERVVAVLKERYDNNG